MKQLMTKLKGAACAALTLAAATALLPAQADTISGVSYRYPIYLCDEQWTHDGVVAVTNGVYFTEGTKDDVTVLESSSSEIALPLTPEEERWYVVTNDVTIGGNLQIFNDSAIHIIVMDGKKLTVTGRIDVSDRASLSVYGQEKGSGQFVVTSESDAVQLANNTTFVINGGRVTLKGEFGTGINLPSMYNACVRINGGMVKAIGSMKGIACPFYMNRQLPLKYGNNVNFMEDALVFDGSYSETLEYSDPLIYINVVNVSVYTSNPTDAPCYVGVQLYLEADEHADTIEPDELSYPYNIYSVEQYGTFYAQFRCEGSAGWQFADGSEVFYQKFTADDDPTYVTLAAENYPVRKPTTVIPGTADHVSVAEVYTNNTVAVTGSEGKYTVLWGYTVRLIWTVSDAGYVFVNGATVCTNDVTASGDTMNVAAPTVIAPIQVGESAYAIIVGGTCTITGTGATWAKDDWKSDNPLKAYDAAITNLVVQDGITGLGANSFENLWYLQNVTLAESVTDIGARAFKKCYGLANVTSKATGASSVGDYAFSGCHSLQGLSFAGAASFGTQSYTLQAAIYMKDGGIPVVYAMPTITVAGKSEHIMGKKTLADEWTDVTNFTDDEKKPYHFFKIEMK